MFTVFDGKQCVRQWCCDITRLLRNSAMTISSSGSRLRIMKYICLWLYNMHTSRLTETSWTLLDCSMFLLMSVEYVLQPEDVYVGDKSDIYMLELRLYQIAYELLKQILFFVRGGQIVVEATSRRLKASTLFLISGESNFKLT